MGIEVGRANFRKSDKISSSPIPHKPVLPPSVIKPLLMKTFTCCHRHHFFILFSFFNLSCEGSWNILFSPELWLLGGNKMDDLRHDIWLIMNIATVIKDSRSGIWDGSGNSRTPSQGKIVIIIPNLISQSFGLLNLVRNCKKYLRNTYCNVTYIIKSNICKKSCKLWLTHTYSTMHHLVHML